MSTTERGFSILEVIVFIVVVGIGVSGILSVLQFNILHSSDPVLQTEALGIAQARIEEIAGMQYNNISGTGTSQSQWMKYQVVESFGISTVSSVSVKMISVTVSGPAGQTVTLDTYRSNY